LILKVSVLASGAVLLDGQPVQLEQLKQALEIARRDDGVVWYYREAAAESPREEAIRVLNLVVQNKLRISLSSRPDFSDYVDAKGISHPRTPLAAKPQTSASAVAVEDGLCMPDVEMRADIEATFGKVRQAARGDRRRSALVILRPDRRYLVMPAMSETPALKHAVLGLQRLVPSTVQRKIAVIAYTVFPDAGEPNINDVNRSIPFVGMLMGLSYIGHAVWVFEGHETALEAGCRDADVLIVDSAMLPLLAEGWQDTAIRVMRNANILLHDRGTFQLQILQKVGPQLGALGFADQLA
jgi:hypothetical protein